MFATLRMHSLGLGDWIAIRRNDPIAASDVPDEVVCYGLGSCVALVLADPSWERVAVAHVVLPSPHLPPTLLTPAESGDTGDRSTVTPPSGVSNPARYAQTVVPFLLRQLDVQPEEIPQLQAWLAGGAQVLPLQMNPAVGARNVEILVEALHQYHIPIVGQVTQGRNGRTLRCWPAQRRLEVREAGGKVRTIWEMEEST